MQPVSIRDPNRLETAHFCPLRKCKKSTEGLKPAADVPLYFGLGVALILIRLLAKARTLFTGTFV